jgi:hypothetical protein
MARRFTRRRHRVGVFHVSDHALLRFMERAGDIDVDGLRAGLARSLTRAIAVGDKLNASDYRIVVDGLIYVVRDNVITTVLLEDMPTTKAAERQSS